MLLVGTYYLQLITYNSPSLVILHCHYSILSEIEGILTGKKGIGIIENKKMPIIVSISKKKLTHEGNDGGLGVLEYDKLLFRRLHSACFWRTC